MEIPVPSEELHKVFKSFHPEWFDINNYVMFVDIDYCPERDYGKKLNKLDESIKRHKAKPLEKG